MRRWWFPVIALCLVGAGLARADSYFWPTYDTGPGPGGFATVTLEFPKHASWVKGPDLTIRLRSDNSRAAVLVKLDGKHIDRNCRPHVSLTGNPTDYPRWEFMPEKKPVLDIPVCRVAPGFHVLEIERGSFGTSLPATNDQRIFFIVER